jgi:4,5-DOPA dioxygenase extradiol
VSANVTARILYLPHGGGPLPLLGDAAHAALAEFLAGVAARLGTPSSILLVSAHWEADVPTLTAAARPALIYDYYGFPEETYHIRYPAAGDPDLARRACDLLRAGGFEARQDAERGFDHGLFVPLKLMYPDAGIPCVQLSLLRSLDPAAHIALGKCLAGLREQNVLVVGSGLSFHNMRALLNPGVGDNRDVGAFHDWLIETCAAPGLSAAVRERRLTNWETAPAARFCHPREEHLLPLHVCYGMAAPATPAAEVVFDGQVLGRRAVALLW